MNLDSGRNKFLAVLRNKLTIPLSIFFIFWILIDLALMISLREYPMITVLSKIFILIMIGVMIYINSDHDHKWICGMWVMNFFMQLSGLANNLHLYPSMVSLVITVFFFLLLLWIVFFKVIPGINRL